MSMVLLCLALLATDAWKRPLREPQRTSVWRGAPIPARTIAAPNGRGLSEFADGIVPAGH
jgi:hypothetical protein